MHLSINDDCGFAKKGRKATDRLLQVLKEQHDYDVPYLFVTKRQVVEIRAEEELALSVNVCVLPVPTTRLTVDGIKRVVCKHFGISHNDLISQRRDHKVQRPRMVAVYLARQFTPHALPALGRHFGNRDHTTILHSIRKMEQMVAAQHPIGRDVTYLQEVLSA